MKTKNERADPDSFYLGLLVAVGITVVTTFAGTLAVAHIAWALSRWWN